MINVIIPEYDEGTRKMFRENGYYILNSLENKVVDLVCFTGGADVGPILYGDEKLKVTSDDPPRDERDVEAYMKYARIPKVGICRGGQFLNVMSGGKMWQHVDNHGSGHIMQNLLNVPGEVDQDEVRVSSTHHQMMIAGTEGEVLAIAMDKNANYPRGIAKVYLGAGDKKVPEYDTEVVWYPKTKSICYQPHPEYGSKDSVNQKYFFNLLNYFFGFNKRK